MPEPMRNLFVILGDQLDLSARLFDGFDPHRDGVWMAEVSRESTHVWSHKARIALFLSGMRHFRDELKQRGIRVFYHEMSDSTLGTELKIFVREHRPANLFVTEPGDWRVERELRSACPDIKIIGDGHFLATTEEFTEFAKGRKTLRLEDFYRRMRRRHDVLMSGDVPEGGKWNLDAENRHSFGRQGVGTLPKPLSFPPDRVTQDVLTLVAQRFSSHPGSLERFNLPVTRGEAERALEDFISNRLGNFGRYQDAMWRGEPWLYHSRLSTALNLKLLHPREVISAAEEAYRDDKVPLASAEGFIRQILGWREYVRGIYRHAMPEYARGNALNATLPLPAFYWTGETGMSCLRQVIGQTLEYGYAHHIQRLMVTGLYALLLGVDPVKVHEWYLAVYVDAVEWVELPNVFGMSQYADGGLMASKPYIASGKYIQRMSNYCKGCRFKPEKAVGDDACPFTTLYWDFLLTHRTTLQKNRRMLMQLRNAERLDEATRRTVRAQASRVRASMT